MSQSNFATPLLQSQYLVATSLAEGNFTTVQAAITAAAAAGGGIVYVKPGTYTENLSLASGVEVVGIQNSPFTGDVIISGVHTPPNAGKFAFKNLQLNSLTSIFLSAALGTANLTVENCVMNITNGWIFDLVNWQGGLVILNCDSANSTNDGIANVSSGFGVLYIANSNLGAGTNVFNTSMNFDLYYSQINCPCTLNSLGGAQYCVFQDAITFPLNAQYQLNHCILYGGMTHNSGNASSVMETVISTGAVPAIAGNGAGVLTLSGLSWITAPSISTSLTLNYTNNYFPGYKTITNAMSPYTVLSSDNFLSCQTSGGAITLNFPNTPNQYQTWTVKDQSGNANVNPITITTPGGVVNFDGAAIYSMAANYQAVNLIANGTSYEVF